MVDTDAHASDNSECFGTSFRGLHTTSARVLPTHEILRIRQSNLYVYTQPRGEKRSHPIPTFCCFVHVPLFDFPVENAPFQDKMPSPSAVGHVGYLSIFRPARSPLTLHSTATNVKHQAVGFLGKHLAPTETLFRGS